MQQAATNDFPAAEASAYHLGIEPVGKRIRVEFNGEIIADTGRAKMLHEARLVPVYYIPREDIRMEFLTPTGHETHCPFKGQASYWTVKVGDKAATNAAWAYENPLDAAEEVRNRISFYWSRMDHWYVDDEEVGMPERDIAPAHANPLKEWLVNEAWDTRSTPELVEKLTECLVANGIPVQRFRIIFQTLHPLLAARAYGWDRDKDEIEEFLADYGVLETSEYLDSPFAAIFDGAAGLRRRLDAENPQLDYPVLEDLMEEGTTDYVAMPMIFSDGQINAVSLTTKRPGGFSTSDLGHLYEIMPVVSRLFEAHHLRSMARTLLDTYLGKQTGQRVMDGRIKRGDGDNVYAVIWFCDLRNSTALSETMPRDAYLEMLNDFLEAMSGAVLDAGGEVLRYIGDAALSIFPITGDLGLAAPMAAKAAAGAARDAVRRMARVNARRAENGKAPIGYGIGLHLGDVMYGNIGAPERLEFTVIGAAANEAARIEALTKETGTPIAISEKFNQCYPGKLPSIGLYKLRGVGEAREVFTLPVED